jgi:hypothetical protein
MARILSQLRDLDTGRIAEIHAAGIDAAERPLGF